MEAHHQGQSESTTGITSILVLRLWLGTGKIERYIAYYNYKISKMGGMYSNYTSTTTTTGSSSKSLFQEGNSLSQWLICHEALNSRNKIIK